LVGRSPPGSSSFPAPAKEHVGAGDLFRRVVLAVLVVRPLAGLEPTLDVALAALGQVLAAELAELSPDHDAVPLGAFLLLARLVRPALARRDAEVGDGLPAGRETHLGIRTQVTDQDDLVDSSSHVDETSVREPDRCGPVAE